MNSKQRALNRLTARKLQAGIRIRELAKRTCENCGEKGGHWISTRGTSLWGIIEGADDREGFWTCPKLYDEDGRRIAT